MSGWTHIIFPQWAGTGTRPFSFLLWESILITLSSPFGMRTTLVGASGRFLLNWRGVEDVILAVTFYSGGVWAHLHQSEPEEHPWRYSSSSWDVSAFCSISSDGVICLPHLCRVACLWQLELVFLWSNLNRETMCSSFKEYCLLARTCSEELLPLIGLGLEGDLTSVARVSLLLGWEDDSRARRVDFSSPGLLSFSLALTLAMISSTCSSCSTSCFQVWYSSIPIWARSVVCRLWRQISTSVDCVIPLGHWSTILRNLSTNVLIDSPFFCSVATRVGRTLRCRLQRSGLKKASPDHPSSWWSLQAASWTIQRQSPWGCRWTKEPE